MPVAIRQRATVLSQDIECKDTSQMLPLTQQRLRELATAGLIITTRLHVASPALAMGVRVIFVPGQLAGGGGGRLNGMDHFFWTNDDADLLPSWYDIPRQPKYEAGWHEMRSRLIAETQRVLLRELTRDDAIPGKNRATCSLTPSEDYHASDVARTMPLTCSPRPRWAADEMHS